MQETATTMAVKRPHCSLRKFLPTFNAQRADNVADEV